MWFRLYDGMIDDPKLDDFDHGQRWLWITALCMASRSPVRGRLLRTETEPLPVRSLAKKAEVDADEALETLRAFADMGMMHQDEQGVWCVSNWDKRQFKADSSTERTQRLRERRKNNAGTSQERSRNVPATSQKRFHSVSGNGLGTPPDTDTDTDTEKSSSARAREEISAPEPNDRQACLEHIKKTFPRWVMAGDKYRQLLEFEDEMEWSVIRRAVEETAGASVRNIGYCLAILRRWQEAGIRTPEDLDTQESRRQNGQSDASAGRTYSGYPGDYDGPPPDDEDDPVALKVRAQNTALLAKLEAEREAAEAKQDDDGSGEP